MTEVSQKKAFPPGPETLLRDLTLVVDAGDGHSWLLCFGGFWRGPNLASKLSISEER